MTFRSFAAQLAVRLSLIGALLGFAGVASYSATHWEPRTTHVNEPAAASK